MKHAISASTLPIIVRLAMARRSFIEVTVHAHSNGTVVYRWATTSATELCIVLRVIAPDGEDTYAVGIAASRGPVTWHGPMLLTHSAGSIDAIDRCVLSDAGEWARVLWVD
jgi:hypothetical protein